MSSDYLKKPALTKRIEHLKGKGFALTSCEMQGWRRTMEDAQISSQLDEDVHLFAVFDGHGGP
jgi:serine/threonine protein phosphatase PrpC